MFVNHSQMRKTRTPPMLPAAHHGPRTQMRPRACRRAHESRLPAGAAALWLVRMFRKGRVSVLVHGVIDYLVGAFLIAAPFLLSFTDDTATVAAVGAGVVMLVLGASSDLPTGLVDSVPKAVHAMLDYVVAVAMIAAPFVLGFTEDATATPLFVVIGTFQLLQTIGTRFLREKGGRRPRAAG